MITKKENEMMVCLIENEIDSNTNYIDDLEDEEEIKYFKEEVVLLKSLLNKLVVKK